MFLWGHFVTFGWHTGCITSILTARQHSSLWARSASVSPFIVSQESVSLSDATVNSELLWHWWFCLVPFLLAPDQYQSKDICFTNPCSWGLDSQPNADSSEEWDSSGTYCCYYERWKLSSCLQKKCTGSYGQKPQSCYSPQLKSTLSLFYPPLRPHTHTCAHTHTLTHTQSWDGLSI